MGLFIFSNLVNNVDSLDCLFQNIEVNGEMIIVVLVWEQVYKYSFGD